MGKNILIVDDAVSMRGLVSLTLKKAGYDVKEASNGKDALKKLSGSKVNMIITDLNMPEMDGIEFIKAVKKMPGYKFIPIVMLTTESQAEKKKEEGKCPYHFGYLKEKPKEMPIPEECLTCPKMLECML